MCDTCDKSYHAYCVKSDLNANLSSWKCDMCKKELNLLRNCLNCKNLVLKDSIDCLCENCMELKKNLVFDTNKVTKKLFILL